MDRLSWLLKLWANVLIVKIKIQNAHTPFQIKAKDDSREWIKMTITVKIITDRSHRRPRNALTVLNHRVEKTKFARSKLVLDISNRWHLDGKKTRPIEENTKCQSNDITAAYYRGNAEKQIGNIYCLTKQCDHDAIFALRLTCSMRSQV